MLAPGSGLAAIFVGPLLVESLVERVEDCLVVVLFSPLFLFTLAGVDVSPPVLILHVEEEVKA